MTAPEGGPRPQPDEAERAQTELSFGEQARFRSEAILLRYGASEKTADGGSRLVYSWRVGWEWHKQFTLSRPDALPTTPETVYSLEYRSMDTNGDSGRYDYSERGGLLETSDIPYEHLKESMAEQYGYDPATVHQEDLLDYLSSEGKKGTGF